MVYMNFHKNGISSLSFHNLVLYHVIFLLRLMRMKPHFSLRNPNITSFFFLSGTLLNRLRPHFSSFFIAMVPCHHFCLCVPSCLINWEFQIIGLAYRSRATLLAWWVASIGTGVLTLDPRSFFCWSLLLKFDFLLNQASAPWLPIWRIS